MRVKDMVLLSLLSAMAFVSAIFIKVPIMPSAAFLKFEIKDAIILIAGIIYGPLPAFEVSSIVSLLEMMTIGGSGPIGFVMNVLSTSSFVCTASVVYKFRRTWKGLLTGLASGCVMMTASMLLWNYIITPYFMGVPREIVASMLLTVFLPFNLIKGAANSVIALLYMKPLLAVISAVNFYDD